MEEDPRRNLTFYQ